MEKSLQKKGINYSSKYFKILHEYKDEINNLENIKSSMTKKFHEISQQVDNINNEINNKIKLKDEYVLKYQEETLIKNIPSKDILTILSNTDISNFEQIVCCSGCKNTNKNKNKINRNIHNINNILRNNWIMSNNGVFCPSCVYYFQPRDICIGSKKKEKCAKPEQYLLKYVNCYFCKENKIITKCIHTEKILNNIIPDTDIFKFYNIITTSNIFICHTCIQNQTTSLTHLSKHMTMDKKKCIYYQKNNISPKILPLEIHNISKIIIKKKINYDNECIMCNDKIEQNRIIMKKKINNKKCLPLPTVLTSVVYSYVNEHDFILL